MAQLTSDTLIEEVYSDRIQGIFMATDKRIFLMFSAYFPPYVRVLPRKISAKMGCSVKSVMIPFMSEGLA